MPVPAVIERRFRSLALIQQISLASDLGKNVEFVGDSAVRSGCNAFGPHWFYLVTSQQGALFYGEIVKSGWSVLKEQKTEAAIRRRIKKLPGGMDRLVYPQKQGDSMGWSFALWAPHPLADWIDLTGKHPSAWASAQFEGCEAFYGTAEDVYVFVKEQLERPDLVDCVDGVLQLKPLTRKTAARLLPKDKLIVKYADRTDLYMAKTVALRLGYPLASDMLDIQSTSRKRK